MQPLDQELLLKILKPKFERLAQQYTANPELQKDLAQEAWVDAWRRLQDGDLDAGDIGMLVQGARWKMLGILDGNKTYGADGKRRATGAVDKLVTVADDSLFWTQLQHNLNDLEAAYHHGEIGEAIADLTPKQQRYIHQRFWLDKSDAQMKAEFGSNPTMIWYRVKGLLRDRLSHLEDTEG